MSKHQHKTVTLDEAVKAARSLPEAAQQLVAYEIMEQIEDLAAPQPSPERIAIIKERLSKPLVEMPREELMAILRKYNPAL